MTEEGLIIFNEDTFLEKYGVKINDIMSHNLSDKLDHYFLYNSETDTNVFNDIIERLDTLTAAEDLFEKLDTLQAGLNNLFEIIALIFTIVVIAFTAKVLYSFFSGIIRG